MTTRHAPRHFIESFANEIEALDYVRKSLVSENELRSPEKRLEVGQPLEDSGHGYKLLGAGEVEYVFCTVAGACEVYSAMRDMITDTEEEARAWIEEAEAMGVQAHWRIFPR